jgi:hypothetical protein
MSLLEKATLITTPTAHSNGTLHSIKGGAVADFDVVRGSAATRVNAEGLIEDISVLSGELVTNGDFSNGSTDWVLGTGWSVSDGVANCDGTQTSQTNLIQPNLPLGTGKILKITFQLKDYQAGKLIYVNLTGTGVLEFENINANGTYTGYSGLSAGDNFITFRADADFIGSIDNISVKEVIDATNIPRIDYTTGEAVVLLEPLSTNLVVNSELNNVENIVVSATAHTISFYGTGSITLSGAHTATLSGTGANDRVSLTFTPSAGTLTCTDSGSVDMKQVEALSYATSYIPTSGAIASRLTDKVKGAGDVNTFNDSEGVLYVEMAALVDNGAARRLSISDGSTGNRVFIGYDFSTNSVQFVVSSGGSVLANQTFIISDATQFNKLALKYKLNDCSFWVNGIKVGTDTNVVAPIGLSEIAFDAGDGNVPFYGKVKALAVFNEALTDSELGCLTKI